MARTAELKIHVADHGRVKRLIEAVGRMRLYEHAGGNGWWAGWEDAKEALAAIRGHQPPGRSVPSRADQDLPAATRRYEVAEAALTGLHAFVQQQLDRNYDGSWGGYHTDPEAVRLADTLQREHERKATPS